MNHVIIYMDIHSGVGVVGLSEEAAGLLVGDAVGSFVLFIILFTSVTSNSRIVALHHIGSETTT